MGRPLGVPAVRRQAKKEPSPREWAGRIRDLRLRMHISQGELARLLDCSAMTVSRWENGQLAPTAQYYIALGKLAGKADCWFYWERAGLQSSDVVRALPEKERKQLPTQGQPELAQVAAGGGARVEPPAKADLVHIPLLQTFAGTQGSEGDKRGNLNRIPAKNVMGAPAEWCPNPGYTSLLRIKGRSMEPLIRDGDIVAVDSSQTDRTQLDGKVVILSSEEKGLCVSRLRRYPKLDVLESENREYRAVVLDKASGWHIVGRVLWWISAAP
jgi:SOS-response transcriptional repressor LexA/DNA-binding XRE family transcriptional regulator